MGGKGVSCGGNSMSKDTEANAKESNSSKQANKKHLMLFWKQQSAIVISIKFEARRSKR